MVRDGAIAPPHHEEMDIAKPSWLTISCRESKDATGFSARSLEFELYSFQSTHQRI
jgi:hypothetical protein